jgi:hypothetical protein
MRLLPVLLGVLTISGCTQVESYRLGEGLLPRIDRNLVQVLAARPEDCRPIAQLYFESRSAATARHMFETRAATLGANVIVIGVTAEEAQRVVPFSVREAPPDATRHNALALHCGP